MEEIERKEMKTVYNGEVMTVGQATAKKAAARRKANAEKKKKNNEWTREMVLPEILKLVSETRKSTRCLKSICAFVDNGPVQWYGDYRKLMKMFPDVEKAFLRYHSLYKKIEKLEEEMDKMLKRSKTNKNFFSVAQDFGYNMFELLDRVADISAVIQKHNVCENIFFKDREIILGAADNRRKGLRHILSSTYKNTKTTKDNLLKLSKALSQAYEDVVQYDYI